MAHCRLSRSDLWRLIGVLVVAVVASHLLNSRRHSQHNAFLAALTSDLSATSSEVALLRSQTSELAKIVRKPARPPTATYTVQAGDSLWRIARRAYGDGGKWGAISVANGIAPDDIEPGMILKIPTQLAGSVRDVLGHPGPGLDRP